MINTKIIIGFAAFAFVVSVLSGIAGGVAFGVLALRTFLGTLLFAGLGAGVSWVFGKYLGAAQAGGAGASASDTRAEPSETEERIGDEVDIVLPEENPHLEEALDEDREIFDADEAEDLEAEEAEDLEAEEDEEDVEELSGIEEMDEGEAAEEADEEEVGVGEGELLESFAEVGGDFSDLDSMPALEGMEDGSSAQQDEEEQESPPVRGVKPVDVMGTAHDPEEAAKAIKTWLKKDEKG